MPEKKVAQDKKGNFNWRKKTEGHPHEGGPPTPRHNQAQHDDEVRIRQREPRHYFASASPGRLGSITFGFTFIPARNSFRLPTTTRSPSANPPRSSTRVLPCNPNCTFRSSRIFFAFTNRTLPSLESPPNSTASSGTVKMSRSSGGATTARTYMPGRSLPSAF